MSTFVWKIGGEAGFGIMTTGLSFSKISARLGYEVFDYIEYPSLIRGGHNAYEVVVSHEKIRTSTGLIDMLVCLNEQTFHLHKSRLSQSAYIVYDNEEFQPETDRQLIHVPFKKILSELKGQQIMKNTIALGASLALMGTDLSELNSLFTQQFGKKGLEVVAFNEQFAEKGYTYIKETYPQLIQPLLKKVTHEPQLVLTGNEAFSLGAVIADCRVYVAYPMTPSSSVLTTLAGWQEKTQMIVRHAEDEIAVINTALGSSFSGVRSAVGTSGGGYALMVESVSFAGIAEIPIVVFVAQRPGPATGMPTWTEQGDLLFTVFSGHGEFPKIVLAPGDAEEMITLTAEAFNLADVYQLPVIVMSDMLLSESHSSINESFVHSFAKSYRVNRGKILTELSEGTRYNRYDASSSDGISPRLIPGVKGFYYQANSYEHLEDGHTTESGEERIKQVEKRKKKIQTYMQSDFQGPKVIGDFDSAQIVFISWGSSKNVLVAARKKLAENGKNTAILHFTHLYPLDKKRLASFIKTDKTYVLVENNSEGQFGKLLQMETGLQFIKQILRFDGRPLAQEDIVNSVAKI